MPLDVLPYQPSAVIPVQYNQVVAVDYSDDRTRYGRKKGDPYYALDLSFNNRDLAEFQAFKTFFDAHYPATAFTFTEQFQNLELQCYFVSSLSYEIAFDCAVNYRVRIEGQPTA